ncbi:alkylation response protein AidB-like acyl-CoA dehydrogenase [Panacagrimonas perspica]|uniref:Acyl-[acyl-carrier-protein] dehydrogenase MbtN n=1 Tax=Panacagrimonas perspica TaxID=381431 RepID=A0A4V3F593_9GAMM|nr:acyl-CoA dehydrogenase family protein [Panacagrimonas perspica]TDU26876.1 alkylation response protein AidB-like acyl-CoA dehydrogenase [Panacagrimonas perspica]
MLKPRPVYSDEHEMFRDAVRGFVKAEITPHFQRWEEAGIVDRSFWDAGGSAGLLCPQLPEEYGGAGGSFKHNCIVVEEIAYAGYAGPMTDFSVHSDVCCGYIQHAGTEEQRRKWLPRMASGETVCAIAMTEPGTGSDLQGIKTRAVRDGDVYRISGSKTFISNGQHCDLVIVVARTSDAPGSKGMSLILVETDRPGFRRGRNLHKLGHLSSDTSEMFFDEVEVPASNVMGVEGTGFATLMTELPQERLIIAYQSMASAQRAFDITVEYTRGRKAFGQAIADFQNTRYKLADLKADLLVGWAFADQCLEKHVLGQLDALHASTAKLWCTEMHGRVVDACLQLHGGYGFMREYEICRLFADARVQRLYGGTSEIMRELISRSL